MRTELPPNLSSIAATAGVSRMTVSRALRNVRGVDPATRLRILAAAEKLGYRPNPLVSAFMSFVRTSRVQTDAGVLAYLTDGRTRDEWRSHGYTRFFNGATERAESRGYRLEEFWLREQGLTTRRLSEILYARGIRGVVIGPMTSAHAHLNLDWEKFSTGAIGYSLLKPILSRASNDQYSSMLLALRELRRLGYERIGMMIPHVHDARVHYHWSSAFLLHHWRYDQEHKPAMYVPTAWKDQQAYAWIRKMRLDAVVTTQSHLLQRLLDAGFDIPGKLGFVHLDWTKLHEPASGIDQQPEQVGGAAVDLAVNQINKNEAGILGFPKTVLLTGTWVAGGTTKNLKSDPAKKLPQKAKRALSPSRR
ncbi:MAG: LacI family DNA-binding transcriptional regulator [Chthoniobacteraceae bacterium]